MRIALIGGLALIAIAILVTLSSSPLVTLGTNAIPPAAIVAATRGDVSSCQNDEVVPGGTTAIRLWVTGNIKPSVSVTVMSGSEVITQGAQGSGWLGKVVTIPVARVTRTLSQANVCFALGRAVEEVDLLGAHTRHPARGETATKVRIEYLQPGHSSWWSLARSVARHTGLARAPEGAWIGLLAIALMAVAVVVMSWTILRELGRGRRAAVAPIAGAQAPVAPIAGAQAPSPLETSPPQSTGPPAERSVGVDPPSREPPPSEEPPARRSVGGDPASKEPSTSKEPPPSREPPTSREPPAHKQPAAGDARARRLRAVLGRVPASAWACACIAFLSAASWSLLTPPFQVTDEPSHFAYTQILAETGGLPTSHLFDFSPEEVTVMRALAQTKVHFNQAIGTISTEPQLQRLKEDLSRPLSRTGQGAGVATSQPPFYYALQTLPYYLGSGGTLLDQLELMRLLSAVMAAFTALFVYLFLREALPALPWAWTVGGLCTALAPLVGFISGAVNPDALLCTVSTLLFYCLARAFRRGFTPRLALAIGAVTAIGFLTKLNFIGLAPGVLLALLLLTRRAARTSKRSAYRSLAIALALAGSPVCLYIAINLLSNHVGLGLVSLAIDKHHGSLGDELGYIWQYYLPRLPGTTNHFPGVSPPRQLWFDRTVGLYGWLDTHFPNWVYSVALIPAGLIAALCARTLIGGRAALRRRGGELLAYAVMGLGLLALIGADAYLELPVRAGGYSEPRYLLPMAALFAAVLALAARGAGRRWGPAVGTLIVLLILAHDIFSQLLVVGRFYA